MLMLCKKGCSIFDVLLASSNVFESVDAAAVTVWIVADVAEPVELATLLLTWLISFLTICCIVIRVLWLNNGQGFY